jgi:O-antigen/teichoic acid export membrane protein
MIFNALNGAVPFLLLPVLTRYLSPAEYGTVSLFQTTLLFIVPLVGLSMGFNIDRLFFKLSKAKLAVSIGNMIFLLGAMAILSTFIIYGCTFFSNLQFTGLPKAWLLIIPIVAGFSTLNQFNLIILRNNDIVGKFGIWQIGFTVLNLGLSLVLVITFSLGWEGRSLGIILANFLVGVLSLYNMYLHGYVSFVLKKDEIIDILKLCLPLLLQGMGVFIIFQSNRYFINEMLGKSAVGLYSVAAAFAAIMGIFQDALAKTMNPWFYKNLSATTPSIKLKIVKMNIVVNLFLISFAFIIYWVSKLLIQYIVDKEYRSAITLVLILSIASAFNGMYKLSSIYFIHLSKTKLLSFLTAATAIISIVLNYFLIKEFGVIGACYSLCISLFIQFLLTFIFAQRIYPLPIGSVINSFIQRLEGIKGLR